MKKIHILSNSHLDREHRHAFQETRLMLVQMIDELIEIMENDPDYTYFTMDGQSIVLDDYLEMKPHMRERLTALIKAGRIKIGPWYSLVDCYSVNQESIVRNLLMGHKVCGDYGTPMKSGYSIFSFGQMAQLPQVYDGFDIHDIVLYKGSSEEEFPQSEFIWKAPNGSKAFTTRLGERKRWNFYFDFDIPVLLGGDASKPGWEAKFTDDKQLCHLNDAKYKNTYANLLKPDIRVREEKIKECINVLLDGVKATVSDSVYLAFDGTDFTSPFRETTEIIKKTNSIFDGEIELVSSNPEIYFDEVKKSIDTSKLKEYTGEMRFGPVSHIHSETMGSNTEIKQAAFYAENTLLNYAEPLSVIAAANGGEYNKDALNLAWKYLFQAHAHDSIHGSGDPKIKTDNLYRIAQVQEIADSITKRAVEGISSMIDFSGYEKGDISLVCFNTTPYTFSDVMEVTIDIPKKEYAEDVWIEDMDGNRLESYKIGEKDFNLAMVNRKFRPQSVYSDRFTLQLYVKDVPGYGFSTYKVKWRKGSEEANPFPLGFFPYKPIGIKGNVLDNGLVRVTILPNGTLDIYDYETNNTYKEMHSFRDIGSCGDFWVHREPMDNRIVSSLGCSADIELIANSSLMATYRVSITMNIPEGLCDDRQHRRKHTIPTKISTDITLKKDSKRIDFKTVMTNQSKDHMFIVDFPTGLKAESASWEAPFEVRERVIDSSTDMNGIKGPELERHAMHNYIDVHSDNGAIALFSKGIKEIGTRDEDGATVSMTLLRTCTGTFPIHNDLFISFDEETSQCVGTDYTFEYALFPHTGNDVGKECRKYIVPFLSAQMGVAEDGTVSAEQSFIKLDKLRVSALKQGENNGYIIRVYNPTGEEINDEISFAKPVRSVWETNMAETRQEQITVNNNKINVSVKPYSIMTLELVF